MGGSTESRSSRPAWATMRSTSPLIPHQKKKKVGTKDQIDIPIKLDKRQEEYIKTAKEMQIKTIVKEVIFWQRHSNFKAVR